jgi:hypothetical protein
MNDNFSLNDAPRGPERAALRNLEVELKSEALAGVVSLAVVKNGRIPDPW